MRAPLSWIRDFAPVDAPVPDIVSALNQLGLEVEGVEQPGEEITGVIAAQVLDVEKHPNADKLSLVDVTTGSGETRVVCGAPNVVAGMVVPYAPAGATLPGGFTLERRKIRGQVSDGMLCSAKELGLGEDHSGILGLDAAAELGVDVRELLGLDDVILDLAITPNRPDAMCIVGVARELAAHFSLDFTVPEPRVEIDPVAAGVFVNQEISVEIEDETRCPRYLGRVARVTMGESPAWMAQRLVKAGMRPISNVVDVTNYVLLERNQPLHAFDLARLGGRGIVVRLAGDGETITTLDGVERALTREDLLICDAARAPQAVAGIMGGSTSEVSDGTTEILLESAYFERMGIARSSKRLKLRSESSARFERGIDPEAVARNADRAMELLVQVAGARVAPDVHDVYPVPVERQRIRLRASRVNAVLGTDLDDEDVWASLAPLGIELDTPAPADGATDDADTVVAVVPTFRPDLDREIDLVEEVARRIGFDRIGRTLPDTHGQVGALTVRQRERRGVADALVGVGLSEAITLSLVAPGDLERAGAPLDRVVRATNPLRAEESVLRTAILPGLLRAVAGNRAHGLADVALFEMGRVFLTPLDPAAAEGPLPDEPEHVALGLGGEHPAAPARGRPARRRLRRPRRGALGARCARHRRRRLRARRADRLPARASGAADDRRVRGGRRRRDRARGPGRARPRRTRRRRRAGARRAARRTPARPHLPRAVALPGVDHRSRIRPGRHRRRRRCDAHPGRRDRRPARGRALLRRVPVRDLRERPAQSGVRAALPGP